MTYLEERIPNRKEFYEALLNASKDEVKINISKICNKYNMSRKGIANIQILKTIK